MSWKLTSSTERLMERVLDVALAKLQDVCDSAGVSMVDASLGWLLAQPMVKSLIVGATSPEQVVANCKQFAAVSREQGTAEPVLLPRVLCLTQSLI